MKHEEKYCPRCTSTFECKAGDILNCQCNTVKMSTETRDFLQQTHYGCLCRNCLVEIEQLVMFCKHHDFPGQKELMIQGLHYYMDNGFLVFTELYHLQRGYCCHNNCRHCGFGYKINTAEEDTKIEKSDK